MRLFRSVLITVIALTGFMAALGASIVPGAGARHD